ncbi:MAG TPA: hypothetical protein PLE19_08450 [Planctomycetota bacterium]|nr:hypothetical protein [Planctomycetota bacterium]HRR80912.1 hypothetical protein [Planctomycetota bacterium]HRT93854.1 hypothetical protein [Planctomycetota bacterium]
MRLTLVALLAALWMRAGLCGEPAAPDKKPKPAAGAEEPEADKKIKELLKTKKVTFDFVETPIVDVMNFMQQLIGVNLIVDPGLDKQMPLTLRVNEMPVGQALQWIARLAGGKMDVRDGAVVVEVAKEGEREFAALKPKQEKALLKADHEKMMRKGGQPFGKVSLPIGNGGTLEIALDEDDMGPEIRALVLRMLHRQLIAELAKQDPEGAARLREAMEHRMRMETEERLRALQREADMRRRAAEEDARRGMEKREKPQKPEADNKGQF